ncbi:MAG: hypothetical protein ACXVEF_19320 [Polyangiales bacterium]
MNSEESRAKRQYQQPQLLLVDLASRAAETVRSMTRVMASGAATAQSTSNVTSAVVFGGSPP